MTISNYEKMKIQTQDRFLLYDQEEMIRRHGLEHDEKALYLTFLNRRYRIDRGTGAVTWADDAGSWKSAIFDDAMTIYDVICDSKKDAVPAGSFCKVNSLKGILHTASAGVGEGLFDRTAATFDNRIPDLEKACIALGGVPETDPRVKGDLVYRIPLFEHLPVILQFWNSDDEFPASLILLWDENIQDFMRYETTFYAAGFLYKRLVEEMHK